MSRAEVPEEAHGTQAGLFLRCGWSLTLEDGKGVPQVSRNSARLDCATRS